MFFCEPCRIKKKWPASLFRSRGPCEVCGKPADCYEVKSSELPLPKQRARRVRTEYVLQYTRGGTPLDWVDGGNPTSEAKARDDLEFVRSEAQQAIFPHPWRMIERVTTERVID